MTVAAQPEKIVITGIGLVSAAGNSYNQLGESLRHNKPGIRTITRFDASAYRCTVAGEAEYQNLSFPPGTPAHECKRMDRFVQIALSAAYNATGNAGLNMLLPERGVLCLGVGLGGLPNMEAGVVNHLNKPVRFTSPYLIPSLIPNMAACFIAQAFNWRAPVYTYASACAGGLVAIDEAIKQITSGRADWALAGGTEAVITPITWSGFEAMRALTRSNNCLPFDTRHNGMVPGEGAALFILETEKKALERGAVIHGVLHPAAQVTDPAAFVSPSATALQHTFEEALNNAGIQAPAAVFAQASGMRNSDESEATALCHLFGNKKIPVTSIKGHTGHTFAASGPLNIAAAIHAINYGYLPGIAGFERADGAAAQLNLQQQTANWEPGPVLVSAYGFGGVHAALVISPYNRIHSKKI